MNTNNLLRNIVVLLGFTLILFGCREDTFIDEEKEIIVTETIKVVNINGIVFNKNNIPLSDVSISINNRQISTDENGVFIMGQVDVSSLGSPIKASHKDYFQMSRIIYPNSKDERIYVELRMTPKGTSIKFSPADGLVVDANDGAKVIFPPNAIVDKLGNSYSNTVAAFVHWYDPTDLDLARNSPGSLEGVDFDGNSKILQTFGMIGVELENEIGEKLQLNSNMEAEISFPIPSSILNEAPEEIPLWSLDEESGLWKEEFKANKVGNEYIGKVNHFSFWNCDAPFELVTISGVLETEEGVALSNQSILIRLNSTNTGYGYTDNTGYFIGKVPKDALLTMTINECNEEVLDMELGSFSSDTDLGAIIVDVNSSTSTIIASLKGCVGEPLTGAYGLVNGYQLLSADTEGNISGILTNCTNMTNQVKFYDGQNINVSDFIDLDFSQEENDLGEVVVCEQLDEFITVSIDGGDYGLIDEPEAFIINGSKIVFTGSNLIGFSFTSEIENVDLEGMYQPSLTSGSAPPTVEYPNGNYLSCSDAPTYSISCDQFTVTFTQLDYTNEIIAGTFEGFLLSSTDGGPDPKEAFVTGSFRCKIVDQFNEASVSGKVWVDLNSNGTRDFDEEDVTICDIGFTRINVNPQYNFGPSYVFAEDGSYTFDGLRPGDYYLRVYINAYELTDFQSGNVSQDNDFFEPGGGVQNYYSYTFTLSDGENLENVDLGLLPPSSIEGYLVSSGCKPEINLKFIDIGGLKPFTAELSDGQEEVFEDEIEFTVLDGGNYTITVTDALGNSITASKDVLSYSNRINGRVWEDKPGEIEGLFESNIDFGLENVEVKLFNTANELIATEYSDDAGYDFDNVPFGEYYVEVVIPAGYSISDMNMDEYYGSVIDPVTARSEVLIIAECFDFERANVGFKAN